MQDSFLKMAGFQKKAIQIEQRAILWHRAQKMSRWSKQGALFFLQVTYLYVKREPAYTGSWQRGYASNSSD